MPRHDFEHTEWCVHRQLFGRDPVAEHILIERIARLETTGIG
jgi:hypothetical protein